ncbi:60S ribosomal protein L27a [Tupaia chinensis]|uniref:Large ribosomal subunit protein uL15 n=1 Tax=Tupaia chinensis TaxID=246437 RepID=L9L4C8_TUPCH|nr:60S ribosomal protein L27a [Tupaia chinensis]
MSSRLRKTRKLRGHVSHGHSRISKHRKHPRGRGNAGGTHHTGSASKKTTQVTLGKLGECALRQVYLALVYLVMALVPSDTACLASSPGEQQDLPRRGGEALVLRQASRLARYGLEDAVDERVRDAHGLGQDPVQ